MRSVALKMLLGDSAKYLALVFGVAFASLLTSCPSSWSAPATARIPRRWPNASRRKRGFRR